ncbi:MAG: amidohydrolase [Ignavibacteriota bacterium]|jgi:predicted amidohydrolase YtcJ|nr:MAG: amidohydrolase [Chlorobiota bacterium]MBE7477066.1 amidohydrolase [Ignavibacteriales bacterium]MBL1121268.1 amidohydrolase [Ignavibacteriota bacterium]MBV6419751.1 N-substituted formamide deformylase [Ignavibacteriaceae bacterium]MCE7856483.1 amidohydrolase [Ignavibacteria bacterium CHB3]MEB2296982.1 amidohydrolase [Ignavibacteria bacterium]
MKSLVTIIILFYFIVGCSTNQNEKADTVFTNGFVYTVDSINSKAEAVAIKDKSIIFIGDNDSVQKYIGEKTKVINLNGKMVLPGFVDAHCHSISSYRYFNELNLYGLKSKENIQNAIKKYLSEHPDAKYIKGRGWSDTDFPGIGPDKKIIDEIVKDIPVSFSSDGGHSKWVNSKTLELAGINNSTKNPKGGNIERYPGTNEPNGTLRENAADLVADIFPAYTVENLMDGLEAYQRMVSAFGITTVHDAYLDAGSNETDAFRNLEKNNKLKMRFRASLYIDPEKSVEQIKSLIEERKKNSGELFQTNSAKIFIDGVVEGSTAYLKEPYKHQPKNYGEIFWKIDSLNKICSALDKEHFQIHVHAIGDAATSVTLYAFASAEFQNGKRDSRNSITHLQLVDESDIKKFKELGVIAVPQPYWFSKDDYYYNIQVPYLGQKRADEEYPMKSFFDEGVIAASSSDYPVTIPCNPLEAIQFGITRSEFNTTDSSEVLWPEERVTLEQMIRSFTINGAYANFLEKETGSIEVGKKADLIVLDKNLFEIPVTDIYKAKVLMTLFEGKDVFVDSSYTLQ